MVTSTKAIEECHGCGAKFGTGVVSRYQVAVKANNERGWRWVSVCMPCMWEVPPGSGLGVRRDRLPDEWVPPWEGRA